MENQVEDQPVLNHIQHLVAEEHRLLEQREHPKADRNRLAEVQVELDQCGDLLRQRRALRDVGLDPEKRMFARRKSSRIMSSRDSSSASGR